MNLLLWRHAEAHDCDDPMQDGQRKLTSRGEKQAKRMAHWLDRQLPQGTQIWVSPAVRAEQTAQALGRHYRICPELAPDADLAALRALLQWPRSKGHLLLVGHQPMLGQLIAELLETQADFCSVRKGAVWWLRSREREHRQQTLLLTVQTPEFL